MIDVPKAALSPQRHRNSSRKTYYVDKEIAIDHRQMIQSDLSGVQMRGITVADIRAIDHAERVSDHTHRQPQHRMRMRSERLSHGGKYMRRNTSITGRHGSPQGASSDDALRDARIVGSD